MLLEFLQLVYCFLPAYFANGSPPLMARLFPTWNAPVDGGKKWRGRRLLGSHKTWRGVILGTLFGGFFFLVQKYLLFQYLKTTIIPYQALPWWFGFLFAFGAIFVGDTGESFFKRRFAIQPGGHWIPWDQIDYTLGALLVSWWLFWPGWSLVFAIIAFNGLLSLFGHLLGWRLRLVKERI